MADRTTTPDPVDVFAGARLRTLRIAAGMSQEALADTAGISFQQVQKYERGTNRLSVSRLHGFAKVLRVEPAVFFPPMDFVPTTPDPIMERARQIYENGRKRVSGRPKWDALNPDDAYDNGMRQVAIEQARKELEQA